MMTGTIVLFLREIELTPGQRAALDEIMLSVGYSRKIPLPARPENKDLTLPPYIYYNATSGKTHDEMEQIRRSVHAHIQGYFTLLIISRGEWETGWIVERRKD